MTTHNTEQRNDAVRHCRIGSCQRHQDCMYTPCRSQPPAPSPQEEIATTGSHIGNGGMFDPSSPLEGEVRDRAVEAAFRSIAGDEVDPHMCPEAWEHAEAVALAILAALSTEAGSGEVLPGWFRAALRAAQESRNNLILNSVDVDAILAAIAEAGKPIQCEPMHPDAEGWSEWVHPIPGYLMQCCDCGLIHEMQFEIVKQEETWATPLNPGEHKGAIAIFRARRSEAGKPAPAEPVAWMYERNGCYVLKKNRTPDYTTPVMGHTETPLYAHPLPEQPREGWQPWESAPEDGTVILAYRPDAGVFTAHHIEEDAHLSNAMNPPEGDFFWFTTSGEDLTGDLPTHWMQLPSPPSTETKESGDA